ncbi:hypothetical protein V8G54_006184 [Vigna mungo]|uniref:Uncharacterized protein n=1 Tax=Vigna mungo TaxID=3915 RepID=A0AAQ3P1R0_VIGMU
MEPNTTLLELNTRPSNPASSFRSPFSTHLHVEYGNNHLRGITTHHSPFVVIIKVLHACLQHANKTHTFTTAITNLMNLMNLWSSMHLAHNTRHFSSTNNNQQMRKEK